MVVGNAGGVPLRLRILMLLALHPDGLHGYAIMKELAVSSGSFYPALSRLLASDQLRVLEGPLVERGGKEVPQKRYVPTREGLAAVREARMQLGLHEPALRGRKVTVPGTRVITA